MAKSTVAFVSWVLAFVLCCVFTGCSSVFPARYDPDVVLDAVLEKVPAVCMPTDMVFLRTAGHLDLPVWLEYHPSNWQMPDQQQSVYSGFPNAGRAYGLRGLASNELMEFVEARRDEQVVLLYMVGDPSTLECRIQWKEQLSESLPRLPVTVYTVSHMQDWASH